MKQLERKKKGRREEEERKKQRNEHNEHEGLGWRMKKYTIK
jgi:hypothetical protein